uniref:NADH-ubiquinone oxidoreductase chain 3 n=1 Tax=Bosmina fatalis TaxID=200852 RepID=A0A8E7MIH9_9CRUS|nr:NADH dehydrogenase subunit 3 [Bosmina fatalis]
MLYLILFNFILFLLVSVVLGLSLVLSMKLKFEREKSSPFECGFDNMGSARLPFSLRFFLLTIIFLIFDVEVVLLLPAVLGYNFVSIEEWGMVFGGFLFILLAGLYHEWFKGALNWSF